MTAANTPISKETQWWFLEVFCLINALSGHALPYWSFACILWFMILCFLGVLCLCVGACICTWYICFLHFLLFYLPGCFIKKERERRCGVEWVGRWEGAWRTFAILCLYGASVFGGKVFSWRQNQGSVILCLLTQYANLYIFVAEFRI